MNDSVGNEIPKRLEASFSRGKLRELASEYESIDRYIFERIREEDEMFIGIHVHTFDAIRSDMQNILKAEIPYACCPFCDAVGCKACLGRGWLGKFRYDATASARKD